MVENNNPSPVSMEVRRMLKKVDMLRKKNRVVSH
jgi:DNA repair exonuclease SbcCD ATPase subunit